MINYRRDGSPFEVLLMITPLVDARGRVRYYLGAQIDVSGLLNDFYGFEHLHQYIDRDGYSVDTSDGEGDSGFEDQDEFRKPELQELSELFSHTELDTVRRHGGRLHHPDLQEPSAGWKKRQRLIIPVDGSPYDHDEDASSHHPHDSLQGPGNGSKVSWDSDDAVRPGEPATRGVNGKAAARQEASVRDEHDRIMSPGSDPSFLSVLNHSASASFDAQQGGHLGGVYDHYLLVRPAPYLRILFASPSLRFPGMVQSSLMERIGGSPQLRGQIEQALRQGQSVTAKVKWMNLAGKRSGSHLSQGGRNRWIHATPLLGRNGEVGVWMVVLVDEEKEGTGTGTRASRSVASSVQENVRSSERQERQERQERKESVGFGGTDAGSVFQTEAEREVPDVPGDGLRPPPVNGLKKANE